MDLTFATAAAPATCPVAHAVPAVLLPGDVLVLEAPKRVVVQHVTGEDGSEELVLFYGDKEVSFDEPHLFSFGETLARQHRFTAGDAAAWGDGLTWNDVHGCLLALIEAGILVRAKDARPQAAINRQRPSPLPPALVHEPANWTELAAITERLTGRSVEHDWLELVIPVFRVAHIALDADDRQVGEANVFPRALRLDRPTEWLACTYQGTRYLDPRPMNVTALKTMRAHWTEMMMALAVIRKAYLARYPGLSSPLTIGAVERLATLVLSVTTYQLVKPRAPVTSGALHPALSSLFRVTDGLRVLMHQMLFVPVGEPAQPPETPVTAERIHDYAERSFAFHSETGVCAGPRHFVRAFLDVLVEGQEPEAPADFAFSPAVAAALAEVEQAFDYGLEGLRAHAALFTFWPRMVRSYDEMAAIIAQADARQPGGFAVLHQRFQDHLLTAARSTYLGSESWRTAREAVYAEMFEACSAGLGETLQFEDVIAAERSQADEAELAALKRRLGAHHAGLAADPVSAELLASAIAEFAHDARARIAIATRCQRRLNARLSRPEPRRPFAIDDINVHVLLQGPQPGKRLPFLPDELATLFGIDLSAAEAPPPH